MRVSKVMNDLEATASNLGTTLIEDLSLSLTDQEAEVLTQDPALTSGEIMELLFTELLTATPEYLLHPEEGGANRDGDFIPITVLPHLTRVLHKMIPNRLKQANLTDASREGAKVARVAHNTAITRVNKKDICSCELTNLR
ncbi:unnamed protein product [Lepeophtheirus salmonis]|uniref:(salmon louse) hypothetical protein n=1 Tax=Lepeophtheirus salmonis TaxID=72036 RepID=A0A7R8H5D2_LEPSM|nr:unnamed protein product [Lepeophtheirus salmonis]CAF2880443.1 unnamed protein product [Lepeophtheirus salmonis]